jgi:hypothetical protein
MIWDLSWATVGEILRFFLACAWIAGIAVLAVHVLRGLTKLIQCGIRRIR